MAEALKLIIERRRGGNYPYLYRTICNHIDGPSLFLQRLSYTDEQKKVIDKYWDQCAIKKRQAQKRRVVHNRIGYDPNYVPDIPEPLVRASADHRDDIAENALKTVKDHLDRVGSDSPPESLDKGNIELWLGTVFRVKMCHYWADITLIIYAIYKNEYEVFEFLLKLYNNCQGFRTANMQFLNPGIDTPVWRRRQNGSDGHDIDTYLKYQHWADRKTATALAKETYPIGTALTFALLYNRPYMARKLMTEGRADFNLAVEFILYPYVDRSGTYSDRDIVRNTCEVCNWHRVRTTFAAHTRNRRFKGQNITPRLQVWDLEPVGYHSHQHN